MWASLAAVVVGALTFGGLAAPTMAMAGPNDFGLSVSNGGVTTVSAYTDQLAFETSVAPQSGVPVKPGAVTKITLDKSLKMTQLGAVPAGSGATSAWDEQSNTLTVTWGELYSGTTYSISVIATPSAVATSTDVFQATAVTNGFTPADVPLTQTATSAPMIVTGSEIPATMPQPVAGGWTAADHNYTLYPGGKQDLAKALSRVGAAKTAFRNLQVATTWGIASGSDQPLPKSWARNSPQMYASNVPNRTVVQDDAAATIYAYGALGGNASAINVYTFVDVPAGTTPGTYSVPFQVLDDTDASGATKTVVASAVLRVVVPEPAGITAIYTATSGASEVSPGQLFDWGQRLSVSSPPGPVKDFTVTLAIPEGATPRGFTNQFVSNRGTAYLKQVEYTTDATVNDASNWQTLPFSANATSGAIALADPTTITGIRYALKDFSIDLDPLYDGGVMTLQVDDTVPVPSTLELRTQSVSYLDPTVGAVTMTPTVDFNKTVQIVEDPAAPPQVAGYEGVASPGAATFGQTYANGNQFTNAIRVGADGATPLEKPYIFLVVPRGMSANGTATSAVCNPVRWGWSYANVECARGTSVVYPAVPKDSGSQTLSDGSTLYYARVTQGQLGQGVNSIQELILPTVTYKLNAMLAGPQKVLMGMGSLSQDEFTVSARNQGATFTKQSLSDGASFGSYAGVASEIQAALAGAGVTTDNALLGERSFTVAPSTSVGSVTTIRGSEDASGIVQGAGTATARPGGSVNYKVDVSNTGAAIYQNFEFIDVLPAVGDTYTLNGGIARGSAFDVNLSGNVQVLVNGVPSTGASVEYTTSATPARFDAAGNDVAGDAWLPFTGAATGAKALRVKLASGVEFAPGDKITLSFDGTVPSSAPRDGSTAKNTIAYRFQTGAGVKVASEAPAVPVKSSAPAGDTQLSGHTFLDLNNNGTQDSGEAGLNGSGVSLQLYKMVSGAPVKVGSEITPNTDAGIDGVFSFIGIDPNETYRVKPVTSNPNVTFPEAALDADGFLKYAQVSDAAANGTENTTQYVGSTTFKVGDAVGAAKWIKDLRLPLTAKTTVSGNVRFTDATNAPVTAGTGSVIAPYVKNYTVKLMQGTTEKATTTTDEAGAFAFTSIAGLAPGDYTLRFQSPAGGGLYAASVNNPAVFSGGTAPTIDGVYKLNGLQPGTGATGVNVFYTDRSLPLVHPPTLTGGVLAGSARVNPGSATLSGGDVGTRLNQYTWQILDSSSTQVAGATVNVNAGDTPTVTIPTTLADGGYTMTLKATDLAGNVSTVKTSAFGVDKTPPTLSSTQTTTTFVKGSPAAPTTSQGWIDLYGVTATDAGVGMPATGGIIVDATAVNTATAGTYTVKFTGKDAAGNQTTALNVTYVVGYVADPTVTLGQNAANYEMGAAHPANDAAWKALFGGVTTGTSGGATVASVAIDASAVNYTAAGTYPVVFIVTDSLGYTATVTGQLTVRDTVKPVIVTTQSALTYRDGDTQITTEGGWIAAFGVTATDAGSGITSLAASGSVDYTRAGTYVVTFTATDNAGSIQTKNVDYTVAFAGTPSITLGNTSVTYEMGDAKPQSNAEWKALFDASATSAAGTTVKSFTVDSSAVDFNTLSTVGYDVTFTVTDTYDNTFTRVGKFIVEDTKKPTAEATKAKVKHKMLAPAVAYTTQEWLDMFDVSATDTQGGSGIDPAAWTVTEGVNYGVAGDYDIEFVARDKAGNASNVVKVTFTVQAPPTGDSVSMKIAENRGVSLDPIGRSTTTGSFADLSSADLGAPSAGGAVELDGKGGVKYTPANNFSGSETLVVTVTDDLGQTGEISYTFTVIKKGKPIPGNLPDYSVPVDGAIAIPIADVLRAVDVAGVSLDEVATPKGFVGKVTIDGDQIKFATDTSGWHGDEQFTVTLKDELGQMVEVPVKLHVLAPIMASNVSSGYAGSTNVTVTVSGLVPGKQYGIELHSDPLRLGSVTANSDGSSKLTVTIPSEATVGDHHLVILNQAKQQRASVSFQVLKQGSLPSGETTSQEGKALSNTGGSAPGLAVSLGVLLLLAGMALFLTKRVRRRA